jgi:GTP-binding protein
MRSEQAVFVRSAHSPRDFITDPLPKVVFAGRSNVGKSSVINALCKPGAPARVGKAPGKTRSVNYYSIDGKMYFVDLPGYGYAKVSKELLRAWSELMEAFFSAEDNVSLGVLVVDARHTPSEQDAQMAAFFAQCRKPWFILANKTDKLKKSELAQKLKTVEETLAAGEQREPVAFSSTTGAGRDEVWKCICRLTAQ